MTDGGSPPASASWVQTGRAEVERFQRPSLLDEPVEMPRLSPGERVLLHLGPVEHDPLTLAGLCRTPVRTGRATLSSRMSRICPAPAPDVPKDRQFTRRGR